MKNNTIYKLQEEIERKYASKVLHILNGNCMLEDFKENGMIREGCTYVPFNEAMCWGEADEVIFGESFIKKRVKDLNTTEEEYRKIVLKPLEPLFNNEFDLIVMWFGDDMFCQMNMLTMMGFLEQINFAGDVLLCSGCESIDEVLPEVYEINLEGSLEKYIDVICRHKMPAQELLPVTYETVKLYLDYRSKTSEISRYIMQNIYKEKEMLIKDLLQTFPQYGLGDLQYEMIIDEL